MLTGQNWIGFNRSATGNETFQTFNPKLNLANQITFTEADDAEIDSAIELATKAFHELKSIPDSKIADFLDGAADEILALDQELLDTYMSESGLPEGRAIGERGRTVNQLRMFATLIREGSWVDARIDTAIPDRAPVPKSDLRKMNIGIGPIVVFGASNFPLAYSTAGGDTASALAAGCPVIVKSHPMHAGTSELVAGAIVKAAKAHGMPEGIFSNLNSEGIEVGKKLASHAGVKGIGFTGSIRGGRALMDISANRPEPIPVFAEMGSINPVILMPNKLKNEADQIAQTYAGSITLGTGQFCTNPGLVLGVKGADLNQFIDSLGEAIVQIDPMCMLHPNISANYNRGKKNMLTEGVRMIAEYDTPIQDNYAAQAVARVAGQDFLANNKLHEEVFGPYSLIVECDSMDQMDQIIQGLQGQLTGTIMGGADELSQNPEIIESMRDRVGRLIFNGVPTGVEVCPSMMHGGPYPASSDNRFTAVGTDSIKRWSRPVSYQNWPNDLLPDALKNENPLNIVRRLNDVDTRDKIG